MEIKIKWMIRKDMIYENTYRDDIYPMIKFVHSFSTSISKYFTSLLSASEIWSHNRGGFLWEGIVRLRLLYIFHFQNDHSMIHSIKNLNQIKWQCTKNVKHVKRIGVHRPPCAINKANLINSSSLKKTHSFCIYHRIL